MAEFELSSADKMKRTIEEINAAITANDPVKIYGIGYRDGLDDGRKHGIWEAIVKFGLIDHLGD